MSNADVIQNASFAFLQIHAQELMQMKDAIYDDEDDYSQYFSNNEDEEDNEDEEETIYYSSSEPCDHPIELIAATYPVSSPGSKMAYYKAICTMCGEKLDIFVDKNTITYRDLDYIDSKKD